ncbi:hypothetical protein PALB_9960 [Pseudoalteromonas luteoviolacea B = ATCC 29581]|nr:hypothetical protein PALB_9960 [Pseudoalteromonas luteoviolacea B = ATCC 29581]
MPTRDTVHVNRDSFSLHYLKIQITDERASNRLDFFVKNTGMA